jgi:hypothetical protein
MNSLRNVVLARDDIQCRWAGTLEEEVRENNVRKSTGLKFLHITSSSKESRWREIVRSASRVPKRPLLGYGREGEDLQNSATFITF